MNKHLVEHFLAFRNSQGRSRDTKDDQEDSLGDEILATDQGARGRMVRPWREADGRIFILGFHFISFLNRDSFSMIVVRFSKVVIFVSFSFTIVIPQNVIDFTCTKVVS